MIKFLKLLRLWLMYLEDGVWSDVCCSKHVQVWRFMKNL